MLPSSLIIAAEHDALKHEGAAYASELQKAGVQVQFKCYSDVIHGFLDLPIFASEKQEAMKDISSWVKGL